MFSLNSFDLFLISPAVFGGIAIPMPRQTSGNQDEERDSGSSVEQIPDEVRAITHVAMAHQ